MFILIDCHLREKMTHDAIVFPITYFDNELSALPNRIGPLHWHPEFEIATADSGVLDFQVGQKHLTLEAGDSIFVNGNILHGMKQLSGDVPDLMPNIVFSGVVVAPETSAIYQKYIQPISVCDVLPFIVFRHGDSRHNEINCLVKDIYHQMREHDNCYEMAVQRNLSRIFEYLFRHFETFPKAEATRIQMNAQIRIRKMLDYIYTHYAEPVTLDDIARAADISRSEAARCFNIYMGCSPVDALIQYRLQSAHRMLGNTALTIQEISHACGFNSVSYFSRQFRRTYGYTPSQKRVLGK